MKDVLRLCGTAACLAGAALLLVLLLPFLLIVFLVLLLSGNAAVFRRFSPNRFRDAFHSQSVPASEDTIDVKATTVDLDEAQK